MKLRNTTIVGIAVHSVERGESRREGGTEGGREGGWRVDLSQEP